MKKLVPILTLLLVLAAMLPLVPAIAGPLHIPHEDPAAAESDFDIALPVLLHYGDVLSLLAEGEFMDMRALMETLDLDEADIPDNIRFVLETYNGLLGDLASALDRLETLIDEAEALLEQDRLDEARLKLSEAKILVDEATVLLEDIEEATDELIRLLGPFAPAESAQVVEDAAARLQEAAKRVEELGALIEASYVKVEEEVESLSSTDITLAVDKSEVWVGETVTASGMLTFTGDEGGPLPDREVVILLDGKPATVAATDHLGQFQGVVSISPLQVPRATLQASYAPKGEDIEKYLSSSSPVAEVEVKCRPTEVTLNLDNTKPWVGDTITASGMLTSPGEGGKALSGRNIDILLDGAVMDTATTQADGSYQGTVVVPHEYIASRSIQARYASMGDKYAPCSSPKVSIEVQFYTPALTLVVDDTKPWGGDTVTASGVLTSPEEGGKALSGRKVDILLDGVVMDTATTQADGSYQGTVVIPYQAIVTRTVKARYSSSGDLYASSSTAVEIEVQFHPTELTLNLSDAEAWVGDAIVASGILTSPDEGQVLSGRNISLFVDGETVTSATTGADGRYQATVRIPIEYVDTGVIYAAYVPQGVDEGKYEPCSSDTVEIGVLFYQTQLEVQIPEQGYPGLPLRIAGAITYTGEAPPIDREIKVFLDGDILVKFYGQGVFEHQVVLYPQTMSVRPLLTPMEGEHTLRVTIEEGGRYAGAIAEKTLNVGKASPEIEIQHMAIITPPKRLRLKGRLVSELPLEGAVVEIEFRDESKMVSTSADGEFEVVFNLPLDSIVMGSQAVSIRARPFEVWHLAVETEAKVFVVDAINLGLVSVAFVFVGMVLYTYRKGRRGKQPKAEVTEPPPSEPEPGEIAEYLIEASVGHRERMLRAYAAAVRVIGTVTNVPMRPQMTMREFLREILPELDGAAEAFAELTRLSEKALYSPYAPEADEAAKAESLALTVGSMLGGGNA